MKDLVPEYSSLSQQKDHKSVKEILKELDSDNEVKQSSKPDQNEYLAQKKRAKALMKVYEEASKLCDGELSELGDGYQ